jgi:hypothetical protein
MKNEGVRSCNGARSTWSGLVIDNLGYLRERGPAGSITRRGMEVERAGRLRRRSRIRSHSTEQREMKGDPSVGRFALRPAIMPRAGLTGGRSQHRLDLEGIP